jgi:hypothetical protein
MADKTALFESAQAIFCAIADNLGSNRSKKVLNLDTYPTYDSFKSEHSKLIDSATNHNKGMTVGVTGRMIDQFLTENNDWYISSVKIAVKLIEEINRIDSDFQKIQKPGWNNFFYVRGAKGGTTAMDDIDGLFTLANKKERQFGDINKWSPADIYFTSKQAEKEIQEEFTRAKREKVFTFIELNKLVDNLLDRGELLPLSLKKVETGDAHIYTYNFNPTAEDKELANIRYQQTKIASSGRDIQLYFGDRPSAKNYFKIRHDPSHAKFGASATLKGEIIYHGSGGRGGSLASFEIMTKVIEDTGIKSADVLSANLKKVQAKGLKDYKDGIDKLNKKYGVEASDSKDKLKRRSTQLYLAYQEERASLSQTKYIGPIIGEMDKWFKEHNKNVKPSQINDASRLILSFIKYTSSRSPKSGKFVIAK